MAKFMLPIDILITDSNILESEGVDGTIYHHSYIESYNKGILRYEGTRLYEARVDIQDLALYKWDDIDPNNMTTTNLHTATVIDSTEVVVEVDDIVYHSSEEQYYKSKQSRTVDFTTEVYDVANWNIEDSALHRFEYLYPSENTLYWKDLGATNRNRVADQALNTSSTKTSTELWFEFEARNIDSVVLFNVDAKDAKITVYTTDINNPVYEDTKQNIIDTSTVVDWRTYSRFVPTEVKSVSWTLPFLVGVLTVRITLQNDVSQLLKLGEILAGTIDSVGLTLSEVPITVKSSAKIIEAESGEVIIDNQEDATKKYEIYNFSMKFDSDTLDAIVNKCSTLIQKRIVVTGEDSDEIKFKTLVVYGFAREASPTLKSNWQKSPIKLQIQRFI